MKRAKAEHPMERIMAIEEHPDRVLVTTTDIHLARDLGDALHHVYQGTLEFHYNDAEICCGRTGGGSPCPGINFTTRLR